MLNCALIITEILIKTKTLLWLRSVPLSAATGTAYRTTERSYGSGSAGGVVGPQYPNTGIVL